MRAEMDTRRASRESAGTPLDDISRPSLRIKSDFLQNYWDFREDRRLLKK